MIFDLVQYCQDQNIKLMAHSCLAFGKALHYPEVKLLAQQKGFKETNILLRWAKEHVDVVLTNCTNKEYLTENMKLDIPYYMIETDRVERMYYYR